MCDDTDELDRQRMDLDGMTAHEFLKKVAGMFEAKTPTDTQSWLEITFTDMWQQQQVMRFWMPSGGRSEDDRVH